MIGPRSLPRPVPLAQSFWPEARSLASCPFPHERMGSALIFRGDMFEVMPWLLAQGLHDARMILSDPPYGVTDCAWDVKINLSRYWELMLAAAKRNAAHCLFAQMPFAFELYASNPKMFRYDLVYRKRRPVGFLNARRMPLRSHELILIFYKKLPVYNPQLAPGKPYKALPPVDSGGWVYDGNTKRSCYANPGFRYPLSIIESGACEKIRSPRGASLDAAQRVPPQGGIAVSRKAAYGYRQQRAVQGAQALQGGIELLRFIPPPQRAGQRRNAPGSPRGHPTQKNIHALAFLIRSYSHPGELIIDPLMGAGSTGCAALRAGRGFIGIEKEPRFFELACDRLKQAAALGEDLIIDPNGYEASLARKTDDCQRTCTPMTPSCSHPGEFDQSQI